MRQYVKAWLLAMLLGASVQGHAGEITLDFNSVGSHEFVYTPYLEDGFRVFSQVFQSPGNPDISLQGHYDLECGLNLVCAPTPIVPGYDGTPWLGTDATSCHVFDSSGNQLPGSTFCAPEIRIDSFGALFTPIDMLNLRGGWQLSSSKGGFIEVGGLGGIVALTGDLRSSVSWIQLSQLPAQTSGVPAGFDNLRLQIPEPGTLALFCMGLTALLLVRWRTRPSTTRTR